MTRIRWGILGVVLLAFSSGASGEVGVTDREVIVGMSAALSGPTAALGEGVKRGVEICFAEVNAAGGVHGRKLTLRALDDGYEPARCGPNMRQLADEAFAVIGNVGTPTAIVAVPIANETKTLLFGAYTGAGVLRNVPPDRYIINYRASYAEETAAMVEGFVKALGIRPAEIGFFTQNDGYGNAGYSGGIAALESLGHTKARENPHGRYERNTTYVEDGLLTLLQAPVRPKAVIMVGAYRPCAAMIKLAREVDYNPIFVNVSFVGSNALARELGDQGDGVVVTQVVPHFDDEAPAVAAYRAAMAAHGQGAKPGFVSLEGYLAARVFVEGLKSAGKDLTREGHIDALEGLGQIDLDIGAPLSLGKNEHQACHTVWPTVIRDGSFVPVAWADLK
jgi:ABC-type branched-subunit amino acid transport system substrate-binding protein